jgi:phytoene dehydrogenase-like protein
MNSASQENRYDVIVIGAGLGGLTAAALLAKAGCKVLVLEKSDRVGGYFSSVTLGKYIWNNGPRLMMGCNVSGPYGPGVTYNLVHQLGVQDEVEFIRLDPFTTVRTPDLAFPLWSGRQRFVEGLRDSFPGDFSRLPELVELIARLLHTSQGMFLASSPWELMLGAPGMLEALYYSSLTMADVLPRYLPDPRARAMVESLWLHLGLPPQSASFLMWALLMASYIDEGAYFCRGGLHKLPEAVALACRRAGGEIRTSTPVTRILARDRQVNGVETTGGEMFFAPQVIANIDPRLVFGKLLLPTERPLAYLRRMEQMRLSMYGIHLSLLTDLDLPALGFGYETLVVDHQLEETNRLQATPGKIESFSLTVMDTADPSLASPGQHMVSLYSFLNESFNPADLPIAVAGLLANTEKHVSGLSGRLLLPRTPLTPDGFRSELVEAVYGWANTPQQSALRRLGQRTPLRGLTLAGQWTRPAQGTTAVILSGMTAARSLLGAFHL